MKFIEKFKEGFSQGIGFFLAFGLIFTGYSFVEPTSPPSTNYFLDSNSKFSTTFEDRDLDTFVGTWREDTKLKSFLGGDCDDNLSSMMGAGDGTCDGDNDGYIDLSSISNTYGGNCNGLDLDDSNNNDESNLVGSASDGTCDGDGDGFLDYTATNSLTTRTFLVDYNDNDANTHKPTEAQNAQQSIKYDINNDGQISCYLFGSERSGSSRPVVVGCQCVTSTLTWCQNSASTSCGTSSLSSGFYERWCR